MAERSFHGRRQAEADLRHVRNSRDHVEHNWAAFAAHQAAENAIRGVLHTRHLDAGGHALSVLLGNLPVAAAAPVDLIDAAKELDKHYIPTRYPSAFERGAPADFYTRREAEQAISNAEAIPEWCRRRIG